ncbi:MAG: hypothetical protein ACK4VJ_00770 [Rhodoluna sp.]
MLININWDSFLMVLVASLGFTTLIVACFSLGVRLLTDAQNVAGKARKGSSKAQQKESRSLVGAYLAFAICFSALAYGIYLIIPFLPH